MSSNEQIRPVAVEFGKRVKAARQQSGLSQEAAAFLAGFDRTFLNKIESGGLANRISDPTLSSILRLAVTLKVDPSVLVSGLDDLIGDPKTAGRQSRRSTSS